MFNERTFVLPVIASSNEFERRLFFDLESNLMRVVKSDKQNPNIPEIID